MQPSKRVENHPGSVTVYTLVLGGPGQNLRQYSQRMEEEEEEEDVQ